MVSTFVPVCAAVVIVCGGAAVAAAAASASSPSSILDASDPLLSGSALSELAVRVASAAVASSSSLAASSHYVQGKDIGEVARVVGSGKLVEVEAKEGGLDLQKRWPKGDKNDVFFFATPPPPPPSQKNSKPRLSNSLPLSHSLFPFPTVGAGAVLGVSAYVLALASAPLLVSLPREGSGSLRVAAARCASALVASAISSSSSAMVSF